MKNLKNNIISAVALVAMGLSFHSCSIDVLPLNEVVYENFWTNKDDVESVVTSCYGSMQSDDVVSRLIAWGESRSDNTKRGITILPSLDFIMKGSIKTDNMWCDWSSLYKVISIFI